MMPLLPPTSPSNQRFDDRVQHYAKHRPLYPTLIIDFLREHLALGKGSIVADIGSGTGISSQLFLPYVRKVCGIEPSRPMRDMAEQQLQRKYSNFISIEGTAEKTELENDSIDFVVAAQSFHWFDLDAAKLEFRRILKRNGYVILIWNRRNHRFSPFMQDYDQFIQDFSEANSVMHADTMTEPVLDHFFEDGYQQVTFSNHQHLHVDALKGRYLSASYSFGEQHPRHHLAMEALQTLFDLHQKDGEVVMAYTTELFIGLFNKHTPTIRWYKKIFFEVLRPFAFGFYVLVRVNITFWAALYKLKQKLFDKKKP